MRHKLSGVFYRNYDHVLCFWPIEKHYYRNPVEGRRDFLNFSKKLFLDG